MNELNGEMSYLYGIDVSCVVIVHCMNDYDFLKCEFLLQQRHMTKQREKNGLKYDQSFVAFFRYVNFVRKILNVEIE